MQNALEHGYGKQTLSTSVLFFLARICYVFPISKCRGEGALGLCMSLVIANRMPLRSGDF